MALDLEKLENALERGGKIVARCPACAELGEDRSADNLAVYADGSFTCIKHTGPHGKDHRRRIAELVGDNATGTPRPAPTPAPRPRCVSKRPLPALRAPTADDLAQIAKIRGWPTHDGVEVLVHRHMLFIADVYDDGQHHLAWVATDSTRANAQARKMDGGVWTSIGGKKPKSLPGTSTLPMIGPADIGTRPTVWLCEGQPDFVAAPIVAKRASLDLDSIAFCCVTGANENPAPLHADDLAHFADKRVVIAVHHDAHHGLGARAAARWAAQLYQAGAAQVRGFDFAGTGKDLADYLAFKPSPSTSATITSTASPIPAKVKESAKESVLLVPLETPFQDGKRYRLAHAAEVGTRLPLFIQDDAGDTLRTHGTLVLIAA